MEMMPRTDVGIDLSRFDPRSRIQEQADPTGGMGFEGLYAHSSAVKRRNARDLARARMKKLARSQLFLASLVGVLLTVTMLFGVVFSTMQLSALTADATRIRRQISALSGQEANLRAQVENRIDLAEIEQFAIQELGMMKPRGEQIVYVDTSSGDFAVVHGQDGAGPFAGLWRMLASLF